jgi:hypothetical protein
MFYKKEIFTTNIKPIELEHLFLKYFKNKWQGSGFIKNNSFLMKPEFKGIFFQVYVEGNFIEHSSHTEVQVEYKIESWMKIGIIISLFFAPLLFAYLKIFDKYIIGSSSTNNLDFFLIIAPVFMLFVTSFMFYNEYNKLKTTIHYICCSKIW